MQKVRCLIDCEVAGRKVESGKDYWVYEVWPDCILVACNTGEFFSLTKEEYTCSVDTNICEAYTFDKVCHGKHCPLHMEPFED